MMFLHRVRSTNLLHMIIQPGPDDDRRAPSSRTMKYGILSIYFWGPIEQSCGVYVPMMEYHIDVTVEAKEDLDSYSVSERRVIIAGIRGQLGYQPLVETKNRKRLRENPISPWELRVGKYRIFYEVDADNKRVTIVAIGHKEHNALLIRRKEAPI